MSVDPDLNSENSSASIEISGQSRDCDASTATPPGLEAATGPNARTAAPEEGALPAGARDQDQAKADMMQLVEPSVGAEKTTLATEIGGNWRDPAAVNPLGEALAALDRKDYATAKRLFEAMGRKDAAAAIENALAAFDRKDYATAQGLFDALAPIKPPRSAGDSRASAPRVETPDNQAILPLKAVSFAGTGDRRPAPQAKKAKTRGLRSLSLRTGLVLLAIFVASAIYSPGTFAAMKSQAIAGLASAVDLVKSPLKSLTGQTGREEQRSALRDLSAAVTQVTIRLDQVEHEYEARLDKLGERIAQNSSSSQSDETAGRLDELEKKAAAPAASSSELADVVARIDKLEKRVAVAAPPASELPDVVARIDKLEKRVAVAAPPASELAEITARLNRLEKKAAVPVAGSALPLPPAMPKQSTHTPKAQPFSNEAARTDNPGPVLRDYSIEDVKDGIAVVDGRNGPQQVAAGDFIPGAGRVLRIEKRDGDWFVLTSRGVIASGPAPYDR